MLFNKYAVAFFNRKIRNIFRGFSIISLFLNECSSTITFFQSKYNSTIPNSAIRDAADLQNADRFFQCCYHPGSAYECSATWSTHWLNSYVQLLINLRLMLTDQHIDIFATQRPIKWLNYLLWMEFIWILLWIFMYIHRVENVQLKTNFFLCAHQLNVSI
jgi:hypothetical protein